MSANPGELRPIRPDAPRHAPEVAFPPYRFLPGGTHPHPERDPAGHSHGKTEQPARFEVGIDLYHAGYLWEAHEVWERLWKAARDPARRDFLQGLIQMAAALLKIHVGQMRGAADLIAKARVRLAGHAELLERFDRCFGAGPAAVVWEDAPRLDPEWLSGSGGPRASSR